jgi:hypothetical protein
MCDSDSNDTGTDTSGGHGSGNTQQDIPAEGQDTGAGLDHGRYTDDNGKTVALP